MRRLCVFLGLLLACSDDSPEMPPPSEVSCTLGVTTNNSFDPVEPGGIFWMRGGGQGNLSLWLAVETASRIEIERTEIDVLVTSAEGEASTYYNEGGLDPSCDADRCQLLFLTLTTRSLVADPLDLADLPVTVSVTLTQPEGEYCAVTQQGTLRRFEG